MDTPAAFESLDTATALELRVLDGPQQGARAPLALGAPYVLAADRAAPTIAADIVLREDVLPPAAVRITAELAQATVEVLQGEVMLGRQRLTQGAQAPWPRHVPLTVGRARVAFGLAAEEIWPDGEPVICDTRAADEPAPLPAPAKTPLHRRPETWLAGIGAAVLVLCASAFGIAHWTAAQAKAPVVADAATIAAELKKTEFAALELTTHRDGRLELAGRLATVAQRQRLDAWLDAKQARASVDVQIDEALAREVTEVFRVHGIAANVRATAPGALVAEAQERDAAKLARAEEVVRRDVKGYASLTVKNAAQPDPPPAPPVSDDPGKRIASIVPGEPAYVVTADGSRYFVGSMLPTGHRITEVGTQSLKLELHGREITLNF